MDAPVGVPSSPVSLAFFLSPEATAGDGAEGLSVFTEQVLLSSLQKCHILLELLPCPHVSLRMEYYTGGYHLMKLMSEIKQNRR